MEGYIFDALQKEQALVVTQTEVSFLETGKWGSKFVHIPDPTVDDSYTSHLLPKDGMC